MNNSFTFKLRIWLWPGPAGWHFVTLPTHAYKELRSRFPKGMVPVKAKIGSTEWTTSLFPHKVDDSYIVPIKKSVRQSEKLFATDTVKISFQIRV